MRSQLHHLVAGAAVTSADAPALTYRSETVTYSELWARVCSAAQVLRAAGVVRGDRVVVHLDKRIETVVAVLATSLAGGIFVPVNPALKTPQVGHILQDSAARFLVTSPERLQALDTILREGGAVEQVLVVGRRSDGSSGGSAGSYQVSDWSTPSSSEPMPDSGVDLDPAGILYTSGSTGRPKGVVVSHRNLVVGAESVSSYLGNVEQDTILSVLPLSFDAGFSQLTTAFAVGAHVVLMNYLLPADVVTLCERHAVTGLTCVPPLWMQLVGQSWPAETAARLRYFANTGGRMPKTTLDQLRALFPNAEPFLMYGLTEAFRSTYLHPGEVDRRPDSIGKAIPNAEILVVRPDGSECDPGEPGELVHRGALVSLGYWNNPEATAERFKAAPLRDARLLTPELAVWSGDTVVRDDEGFLYFVGRTDEMIKTSGYRVSPTEVEEAAYASGLVGEAVALGVEDAQLGQHIVLVVGKAEVDFTPETLLASLRRSLPLYMVPQRIIATDQIPRSPNGKFDRVSVRENTAP